MPYAGESAGSGAKTGRTTASMSSNQWGRDDTMDGGIGQEKGGATRRVAEGEGW